MSNEQDPDVDDEIDADERDAEDDRSDDVSLKPGSNADDPAEIGRHISPEVRALYDVYSYRHAAAILATSFPEELAEIQRALLDFRITTRDIGIPGGNESDMPKKFSRTLRPAGWVETRIQGDLLVRMQEYDEKLLPNGKTSKSKRSDSTPSVIENFIDGHKIDYVKGRVAFDMEWNSKDQTFDRDLYAMRAFHEYGLISLGVMVTRSEKLNPVFEVVPQLTKAGEPVLCKVGKRAGQIKSVRSKYGASTTWMGKLLYRLNTGRHGGCPILVFGITPKLIEDWEQ